MKLYACQGTCSLAPHILLHEFAIPHDVAWVNLREGEARTPEFLEVNPAGQVPVLITDENETITEVTAISLYLFQKHGVSEVPLHQVVRHLSFISTELHKSFFGIFFKDRIHSDEAAAHQLADFYKQKLRNSWQFVNSMLPANDDLDGRELGPADPYLYTVCRWWLRVGETFDGLEFLEGFLNNMEARPSVQAALKHEGLEPVGSAAQKDA